jgi:ABC-2 type transport system ATP-binding protein
MLCSSKSLDQLIVTKTGHNLNQRIVKLRQRLVNRSIFAAIRTNISRPWGKDSPDWYNAPFRIRPTLIEARFSLVPASPNMPSESFIVEVQDLCKRYGDFYALRNCCLKVPRHSVFGLLGPNGAGKTTLIRSLLGYLKPTSGSMMIDGLDCTRDSVAVRRRVGYMPAEAKLFRTMRGVQVLKFFAQTHPCGNFAKAVEYADRLQLDTSRRVAYMSTGMRQKLALASVMSCETPFTILDEPTANLDPSVRNTVLKLVREVRSAGRSVLFSSHVLSEIEEVCDHAAIMKSGQVVEEVNIAELKSVHRISGKLPNADAGNCFRSLPAGISLIANDQSRFVLHVQGPLENALRWMADESFEEIRMEPIGMRQVYDRLHLEVES